MKPSADKPKRTAVNFTDPSAERAVKLDGPSRPAVKFRDEQPSHRVSPGTTKLLTRKPTPFSNELQRQIRDSGLAAWAAAERAKEELSGKGKESVRETSTAEPSPNGAVATTSNAAPAASVADAESVPVKDVTPANGT